MREWPELESGLTAYFRFYDEERPHQSLGYRTPAEVYRAEVSRRLRGEGRRPIPASRVVSFAGLNILGSGTQSTGRKLVNRDDSGGARGARLRGAIVGGNQT